LKSPDLSFIQGSVSSVDFAGKVAHIVDAENKVKRTESYDYLIASSGLRRSFPTVPQSLRRDEFLNEAKEHMANVKNARDGVVIVGGGTYDLNHTYVFLLTFFGMSRCCRCRDGSRIEDPSSSTKNHSNPFPKPPAFIRAIAR
jgi:hypothetical protein